MAVVNVSKYENVEGAVSKMLIKPLISKLLVNLLPVSAHYT